MESSKVPWLLTSAYTDPGVSCSRAYILGSMLRGCQYKVSDLVRVLIKRPYNDNMSEMCFVLIWVLAGKSVWSHVES